MRGLRKALWSAGVFVWVASLSVRAQSSEPGDDATTRVQIVNGTSVESIALSLNGEKLYPDFPQGLFTNDGSIKSLKVKFEAENKATSVVAESKEIEFQPNAIQSLVLLGDFDVNVPPGTLRQPGPPPPPPEKPYPPNVLFRVYPHEKEDLPSAVRLRVINGMPGKSLTFTGPNGKVTLLPGEEHSLKGQKPVTEYVAEIEESSIPILMRQESAFRNAMLIFFLKPDGSPHFKRIFENY